MSAIRFWRFRGVSRCAAGNRSDRGFCGQCREKRLCRRVLFEGCEKIVGNDHVRPILHRRCPSGRRVRRLDIGEAGWRGPTFGNEPVGMLAIFLRPVRAGLARAQPLQERYLVERLFLAVDPAAGDCLDHTVGPAHRRDAGVLPVNPHPQFAGGIVVQRQPCRELSGSVANARWFFVASGMQRTFCRQRYVAECARVCRARSGAAAAPLYSRQDPR